MVATFLLTISIRVFTVACVTPRRTQNDLLEAFKAKHNIQEDRVVKEESTANHGQSAVLQTILNQHFPDGTTDGIPAEELKRLFSREQRPVQIQVGKGKDTTIEIPNTKSESEPESANYTFFLKTREQQHFNY